MGEKVQALAKDAVTLQIGPASSGDRAALRALAESLGLGYAEDEAGRMRIGPASAGDQSAVLTKAAALGLAYGVYNPGAQSAQSAQGGVQTGAGTKAASLAQLFAGLVGIEAPSEEDLLSELDELSSRLDLTRKCIQELLQKYAAEIRSRKE